MGKQIQRIKRGADCYYNTGKNIRFGKNRKTYGLEGIVYRPSALAEVCPYTRMVASSYMQTVFVERLLLTQMVGADLSTVCQIVDLGTSSNTVMTGTFISASMIRERPRQHRAQGQVLCVSFQSVNNLYSIAPRRVFILFLQVIQHILFIFTGLADFHV